MQRKRRISIWPVSQTDATFVILTFGQWCVMCVKMESARKSLWVCQWRNFARGCPWARDGWVPHWLRRALRKLPKIEARNAREPCSVGSRSPLKGPGGVQGQSQGSILVPVRRSQPVNLGGPAMFVLNPSVGPVEFYPSIYNSDPTNLKSFLILQKL